MLLLAHRVAGTSLLYSLDDGNTWSNDLPLDACIGACPGMLRLNDSTVLVVYYGEGGSSSIRARRLRASREGVDSIGWE